MRPDIDEPAAATARARPAWRAVAVPDEHGGWGLTAEPVLLGLLVVPSWAGAALGAAAFLAFVVRTPLKLVLVDRWRHRWLPRSGVALRIAAVELTLMTLLAGAAGVLAGWSWLVPAAVAAPLVAIELWFDMRSRGRRLVPELCGAAGIAAVVASVALAGGASGWLAGALWLLLAARSGASIPFVRVQIARLRHGPGSVAISDSSQVAAALVAVAAVMLDPSVLAGAIAVGALLLAQVVWVRRTPPPAKVLGVRQLLAGVVIVAVTAVGVLA
jgi:hypothetical protein